MSLEKLREWVGRTRAAEDLVTPFPVRALSATLDEPDPDPVAGDALPPLWHWLFFVRCSSDLDARSPRNEARRRRSRDHPMMPGGTLDLPTQELSLTGPTTLRFLLIQ